MPTNAEIFAGPNKELNLDNIIQVAKTHRNKDIVLEFNKGRTENQIHIATVGARISRSIDAIADRDGVDRKAYKERFEGIRQANGVAGRNQHTIVPAASPEPEVQDSTPYAATQAKKNSAVGDAAKAPVEPAPKRKRSVASGEGGDAESQRDSRPVKKVKTTLSAAKPYSAAQGSGGQANGQAGRSRGSGAAGTDGNELRPSPSSSSLGTRSPTPPTPTPPQDPAASISAPSPTTSTPPHARTFSAFLEDSEANKCFSDRDRLNDDGVYALAARLTVPEIQRSANRGAGNAREHTRTWIARRIGHAVRNLAQRRGRSVRVQRELLVDERARNGVNGAGMRRTG